jgi:hypothetical protein
MGKHRSVGHQVLIYIPAFGEQKLFLHGHPLLFARPLSDNRVPANRSANQLTWPRRNQKCLSDEISSCFFFVCSWGALPAIALLAGQPQPDEKTTITPVGTSTNASVASDQDVFFRDKVLPLLESRCFECHGDEGEVEGELRLTSRKAMLVGGESGPVIVPSDPDKSLLIQAVRYESFQMPPRNKMPDEEIEILVKWIKDGAVWPSDMETSKAPVGKSEFPLQERIASHWAWKKIAPPEIPHIVK